MSWGDVVRVRGAGDVVRGDGVVKCRHSAVPNGCVSADSGAEVGADVGCEVVGTVGGNRFAFSCADSLIPDGAPIDFINAPRV